MDENTMNGSKAPPNVLKREQDEGNHFIQATPIQEAKRRSDDHNQTGHTLTSNISLDHESSVLENEIPSEARQKLCSGSRHISEDERKERILESCVDSSATEEIPEGGQDDNKNDSDSTDHTITSTSPSDQNKLDRRKMRRFRLTHNQTRFLLSEFIRDAHPDAAQRERLAREIPGLNPRQVQVWFQNRRAKLKQFSKADQERMLKSWALPANFDATRLLSVSQQGHAADNEPSDRVLGPAQSKALVWRYLNPATLNTIGSSERQIFEPLNLEIHNTASRSKQIAEQDSSSSAAYQSRNANTSHGRSTMVLPGGGISPIKSPGVFTSHDFQTQFIGQRNHNWSSNAPEGHSQDYPSSTIGYSQSASGNPLQIYPHGNPLPLATANHHQTDLTTAPADTVPQSANVWNNTLTQAPEEHHRSQFSRPFTPSFAYATHTNYQSSPYPHSAPAYMEAFHSEPSNTAPVTAQPVDTSLGGGTVYRDLRINYLEQTSPQSSSLPDNSTFSRYSQEMDGDYSSQPLSTPPIPGSHTLPREEECMAINGFFYPLLPYDIFQNQ